MCGEGVGGEGGGLKYAGFILCVWEEGGAGIGGIAGLKKYVHLLALLWGGHVCVYVCVCVCRGGGGGYGCCLWNTESLLSVCRHRNLPVDCIKL